MNNPESNTTPAPQDRPWLTLSQAAELSQFGQKLLRREVKLGRLRAARIGGRGELRIHRDWIAAWMERSTMPIEVSR